MRWLVCGRRLYAEDGRFEMGNLQDWQHSAMYAAFLLSSVVDLLGWGPLEGTLPHGSEHVSHLSFDPSLADPLLLVLKTCLECVNHAWPTTYL